MRPISIVSTGMVTSVGFSADSTCAAIRVGIGSINDTKFMIDGEWLLGSQVSFDEHLRGRNKLLRMIAMAIDECIAKIDGVQSKEILIFLCLPESIRPGRLDGLDESFLNDPYDILQIRKPPKLDSMIFTQGITSGVRAIIQARKVISHRPCTCIVAGIDTFLTKDTLQYYHDQRRLLTEKNTDGFIPGEAAAAVALEDGSNTIDGQLTCLGAGIAKEPAPLDSGKPLRADGIVKAIKAALIESKCTFKDLHYRITDLDGEHYGFKESCLALARILRERKEDFDIWHPAECIGKVGAASVPLVLGVALYAARKGYAPGPGVLCHFSNDDMERASLVLQYGRNR